LGLGEAASTADSGVSGEAELCETLDNDGHGLIQ